MKPQLSAQRFALTFAALGASSLVTGSVLASPVTAEEVSLGEKDEKKDEKKKEEKDEKKEEKKPKKGGDEGGCGAGSCG